METINFTRGVPANESFPTAELIDASTAVFKSHGNQMLQYGPSRGFEPLRQWLAEWQRVEVDRVMTANGSLQLIEFLCLHMIKPGDLVFTESPSYDRTLGLLRRHGARVVGIEMEPDGPNIDALESALKKAVPKFFYLIPDFQNPAGATCSGPKRRQIVELANKYNLLLVEDAPYRMLRYRGTEEPTLYELAPERTLHMSSFTKLIAPVFAAASCWVTRRFSASLPRLPRTRTSRPATWRRRSPGSGAVEGCCRRRSSGSRSSTRRAWMRALPASTSYMPDAKATKPDGGFFISLTLPEGVSTTAVRAQANSKGLNLADGLAFFPEGGGERFIRLPFCALSPKEIDDGVKRLSEAVKESQAAPAAR